MEQPLIDFNSYPLKIALKRLLKDKATKKILYGRLIPTSTLEIVLMIGFRFLRLFLLTALPLSLGLTSRLRPSLNVLGRRLKSTLLAGWSIL